MGEKVEIKPWIGLTNRVQHVGTQEVELEHAGEKRAVDGSDPVCSFILFIIIIFIIIFVQLRYNNYNYIQAIHVIIYKEKKENIMFHAILEFTHSRDCVMQSWNF